MGLLSVGMGEQATGGSRHFCGSVITHYRNYYDSDFISLMEQLGFEHQPHDTRHTCISLLAEAHVDQTMIKKIVGHSGAMTLTEKVYTHLDISALVDAINSI